MNQQKIHDDVLVVHLTVNQIREVILSTFQQASSLPTGNQSEIIDIEEAMKLTGYKKATIYKLIHERKIPFHKPAHGGRKVYFKSTEIDQWLQSNRIETYKEFAQDHMEVKREQIEQDDIETKRLSKLNTMKLLLVLFTTFQGIIRKYVDRIQELEQKIANYEGNNQINNINGTEYESK